MLFRSDSYRCQLAFYAKAWQKSHGLSYTPRIINVGINAEEPCPCQHQVYTVEEQEQAYREFLATAYLWFSTKKYWPVGEGSWKLQFAIGNNTITA